MLSVLELFDGNGKPPSAGVSSLRLSRPIVISQSFILPNVVHALGVTVTDAGIAYRGLIVALASGRLAAIQERFMDPRRFVFPPYVVVYVYIYIYAHCISIIVAFACVFTIPFSVALFALK